MDIEFGKRNPEGPGVGHLSPAHALSAGEFNIMFKWGQVSKPDWQLSCLQMALPMTISNPECWEKRKYSCGDRLSAHYCSVFLLFSQSSS